jgi:hypothetical protein
MLDIRITVNGDKVILSGLNQLAGEGIPAAIDRGLIRSGEGVFSSAFAFLSGPGGAAKVPAGGKKVATDYTGFTKKSGEDAMFRTYAGAGAYPVPVRTGMLRRLLDWLHPGQTKTGPAGSFSAGRHEVVIFDSAQYHASIHEGFGSSAKFGPRRFLTDGLEKYNQGNRIKGNIEHELATEIAKDMGR